MKHWCAWAGIATSTGDRLKAGHLPDPVRLNGALRAENLSLSWLVDGTGSPYLVTACYDEVHAIGLIETMLRDEPGLRGLIAHFGERLYVPILYQPAEVVTPLGTTVQYTAATIFTGNIGYAPRQLLTALHQCQQLRLTRTDWVQLATGLMSNSELFGWADRPGLMSEAVPIAYEERAPVSVRQVWEEGFPDPYGASTFDIVTLIKQLPPEDRDAVLHIVRRLRR